ERPHEVEVLLDGQRPEVIEAHPVLVPAVAEQAARDVAAVQPQPALAVEDLAHAEGPARQARHDRERDEQRQVVEREDPEYAAQIESPEWLNTTARVQQDARDQESGEYEEQIDTAAAGIDEWGEGALHQGAAREPRIRGRPGEV